MSDFLDYLFSDTFSLLVTILGSLTSIVSLLVTILSYAKSKIREKEKLKLAIDERFEKALASDNIVELGSYLRNNIGEFNLYEYASNATVSQRVDKFLNRLQRFVGTTEKVEKELPRVELEFMHLRAEELPEEFQKILNELRTGEAWNALARLRRHIEMTLRQRADQAQLNIKKFQSAGQLLRLLHEREILNRDIYKPLEYAIAVCNRAIHGIEVSHSEAEEAIFASIRGLQSIGEKF